jgi:hypothetical protein
MTILPDCDHADCNRKARNELIRLYWDDDDRRWSTLRCCDEHLIEFVDREVR